MLVGLAISMRPASERILQAQMNELTILAISESDTYNLGLTLGQHAKSGDIICLIGDLGAGKTVLTQGVGAGLGLPSNATVNSPTYTIVAERPGGRLPLYHFDLYRIKSPLDLVDIAADDYLEGTGLCVVEWADLALEALGPDLLIVNIEFGPTADARTLTLTATGPAGQSLLNVVSDGRMHS
jgi:tRNA threonylcarbamoyladenosine biosynthesis protein TsaE